MHVKSLASDPTVACTAATPWTTHPRPWSWQLASKCVASAIIGVCGQLVLCTVDLWKGQWFGNIPSDCALQRFRSFRFCTG
jgi:hypothetical protein